MKKNIKNLCILLCMVLVFTGVTACAGQQEEGNTMADVPASQTESSEKTEADNTEEVYQELTIDQQQLPEYYDFVSKTYNDILSEKENENIVYAPMNFYLSLSMLSEMTENEARKELQNALGDRRLTVCRELTKKFETAFQTTFSEAIRYYEEQGVRGECVLVIEGRSREELVQEAQQSWEAISVEEHMEHYLSTGMDRKSAMKQVAKDRGVGKREIYQMLLKAENE